MKKEIHIKEVRRGVGGTGHEYGILRVGKGLIGKKVIIRVLTKEEQLKILKKNIGIKK